MIIVANMQQSHLSNHISENFKLQYPHKTELRQGHRRVRNEHHKGSILFIQKFLYYVIFKNVLMSHWIDLLKVIKHYLMRKKALIM